MPVAVSHTPNPNAMKFVVSHPVGGPATFTVDAPGDDPMVADLLAVDGVTAVFCTADFITVTKREDAEWGPIEAAVTSLLETHFP